MIPIDHSFLQRCGIKIFFCKSPVANAFLPTKGVKRVTSLTISE
jgi:hypothetical protein